MLIVTKNKNCEAVNLDRMASIDVTYISEVGWIVRGIEQLDYSVPAIEIAKYDMQDKAQQTLRKILDAYNNNERVFYVD
jgi:hypothetical protein